MIVINKNSHIYICCLSSLATGGTELLHQLGYKLKSINIKTEMYYYNYDYAFKKVDPIAKRFKKFNVNYTTKIEDKEGDVIIIPEIALFLVNKFKKAKVIIWWLSVDFYLKTLETNYNYIFKKKAIKQFLKGNFEDAFEFLKLKNYNPFSNKNLNIIHLVQSEYANDFLLKNGIESTRIYYLSDYLNENFLNNCSYNNAYKINRVLYNPMKGLETTKKIMRFGKDIMFTPIQNLNPNDVAKLLRTSKVYIDFGNHPGKDRIPREAAISGAIVITNKKGSAAFDKDVSIPISYKFEENPGFEMNVIDLINDIFKNYEKHFLIFSSYREIIKEEETKFNEDLKKIFIYNH